MYFKSNQELKECLKELEKLGYKLQKKKITETGEYQLVVWHNAKVDLPNINKITWALIELVEKRNGYYDGWETQFIN